jgi:SAM-dependent methyltransferase
MATTDSQFSAAIAQFYDRYFGRALFGPYAEDIARRLADLSSGALLEIAAGTGIVTAVLARSLPAAVEITATDLNQAMLDFAAAKPGLDRVRWQQADAVALPFADASFEAVVCQFGAMFFPDRRRAYAEVLRTLRPGGRYIFNVWDSLARNPVADIIHRSLACLYPVRPPSFIARVPFGYHDGDIIRADLEAAGFRGCAIEPTATEWCASSIRDSAVAFCQGSPLRSEIEAVDPAGPARATAAAAAAVLAYFGDGPPAFPMQALVVEATR